METELIKVNVTNEGKQVVSAKELYEGLGLNKVNYSRWAKQNIEDNVFFENGIDWEGFFIMKNGNQTKDYALSINFAKHLAMSCQNENGKKYRDYFLKLEQYVKDSVQTPQIPTNYADALRLAAEEFEKREKLQIQLQKEEEKVKELIPNKIFTDKFFLSPDQELFSLHQTAQLIGKGCGRTTLIKKLREKEILQQKSLKPMQQYLDRGWFQIKITSHRKDDKYPQTFVTRKGFGHICNVLGITKQSEQLNLFN